MDAIGLGTSNKRPDISLRKSEQFPNRPRARPCPVNSKRVGRMFSTDSPFFIKKSVRRHIRILIQTAGRIKMSVMPGVGISWRHLRWKVWQMELATSWQRQQAMLELASRRCRRGHGGRSDGAGDVPLLPVRRPRALVKSQEQQPAHAPRWRSVLRPVRVCQHWQVRTHAFLPELHRPSKM